MNNIKRNIFGNNISEVYAKINKNLIINNTENTFLNLGENHQLGVSVYLTLIDNVNYRNEFEINLNRFIEKMGYVPKYGTGKINYKVLKSFKALNDIGLLDIKHNDGQCISGTISVFNSDDCFDMNIYNIVKINNSDKYTHKSKVIYLYSYIIASDYKNSNLSVGILSKKCNLTKDFVLKCLDQFHKDGLIDKKYISTSRIIKEEDKPYVYIHINKLNGEVLYVGKGRNERYCDLKSRNSKYTSFISEIGEDNIECKIIDYFDNDYSAYVYEYEIVSKYRAIGQAKYCIVLGNLEIKDGQ